MKSELFAVLLVTALAGVSLSTELDDPQVEFEYEPVELTETYFESEFQNFKSTFEKQYDDEEDGLRYSIFKDNLECIHSVNAENLSTSLVWVLSQI